MTGVLGVARLGAARTPQRGDRRSAAATPALPPNAALASTALVPHAGATRFRGLVNHGVTCFFNSVIQSLASVSALAEHLDRTTRMAERYDVATPVTDALRELIVQLNTPDARGAALAPRALMRALGNVSQSNGLRTLVSARQQQDAHELAVLLLTALDEELAAGQKERATQRRAERAGLRGITAPSEQVHGRLRRSLGADGDDATNPFHGIVAQRTSCGRCGYSEAVRHFALDDLSLVPEPGPLERSLAAWAQLEQVEWTCFRCSLHTTLRRERAEAAQLRAEAQALPAGRQKRAARLAAAQREAEASAKRLADALQAGVHEGEAEERRLLDGIPLERAPSAPSTKQVMLARPPPVLVLHLNRSAFALGSFGPAKNHVRVTFPEWLDMAPYTTGAELSTHPARPLSERRAAGRRDERLRYRLSAVVTHYGAHNYGHYVCYRRRPKGVWTRISDETVQACTLDDVRAQNPFLLFYERGDVVRQLEAHVAQVEAASASPGDSPPVTPAPGASPAQTLLPARRARPRMVHRWSASPVASRETTPA